MKGFNYKLVCMAMLTMLISCTEYLDVVPDNTLKLENIYATKEDAYDALAKIYSFMPRDWQTHETMWHLGDEYLGRIDASVQNNTGNLRGERIMRGLQTVGSPLLGSWSGTRQSLTMPSERPTCSDISRNPQSDRY